MATGTNNWLDISCFFGHGISEADLKDMLPAGIVVENGFICSDKQWSNQNLASIFTAIFGLGFKSIDNAPCSQAFVDALFAGPFCDKLDERFQIKNDSGFGTLSVTAPNGGNYDYLAIMDGAADARTFPVGGIFASFNYSESDPDDDIAYGGSRLGNVAGGGVLSMTQPGDGQASMTVLFIRRGCL